MVYILFILNVHQRLMGHGSFVSLRYYWGVLGTLGRRKELGEGVRGHWGPAFAGNIGTQPLPLSLLPRHFEIMRFSSNILCPFDALPHHSPKAPVTNRWSKISETVSKSNFCSFEVGFLRDFCCSKGKLTQLPPWEVSPL